MAILLERADKIGAAVVERLKSHCERIEVVGSVRRRKRQVKDIDFVLIPSAPWSLHAELRKLGTIKASGGKLARVMMGDIQLDFYFATAATWHTLLLIRTGSAENNIRLCSIAKNKGWHLSAAGDGLFNESGERIAGDSEESIYEALGIRFQPPERR